MTELDWRAIRELAELRSRFREALERALIPVGPAVATRAVSFEPSIDVWETDSEVVVEAELPAARVESVEVRLERDTLVIAGEIPPPEPCEGRYLRVERPRGRFHRVIQLPAGIDGRPQARLHCGVLEVRLPRGAASRRNIVISGSES
ncbi:MAG: Hsp20/alpha crystallin family protein [Acidobacteriota bacterium]